MSHEFKNKTKDPREESRSVVEAGQDAGGHRGVDALAAGRLVLRNVQVRTQGQHQLPGPHQRQEAPEGAGLQHARREVDRNAGGVTVVCVAEGTADDVRHSAKCFP